MKVKVAKWGNSLGVRLPKAAADTIGITAGSELDLIVENGGLRLRGITKTSAQLLKEMLDEIDRLGPGCVSETIDWGPDRGSEIIEDAYSRGEITFDDIVGRPAMNRPAEPAVKPRSGQQNARPRRR